MKRKKPKSYLNKKCDICKKGKYICKNLADEWDGTFRCNKCGSTAPMTVFESVKKSLEEGIDAIKTGKKLKTTTCAVLRGGAYDDIKHVITTLDSLQKTIDRIRRDFEV